MIGAGAVVIKDIRDVGVYIGVPAERIGLRKEMNKEIQAEFLLGALRNSLFIYRKHNLYSYYAKSFIKEGCVA